MEIRFIDYYHMPQVDLQPIHQAIMKEDALLKPSLDSLQQSYEAGMSVVMMAEERPVGHVRFSPLLNEQLKDHLCLDMGFPSIWEIGTAVIINDPEFRGKGYYADLRNALLEKARDQVCQNSLLILGTTKSAAVLKVLPKARQIGIDFYPCCHMTYPFVAPFTCVCEGDFGQGVHLSSFCPARSTSENVHQDGSKIPCLMYVSSRRLAQEIDDQLKNYFQSMDNLVGSLRELGYYR